MLGRGVGNDAHARHDDDDDGHKEHHRSVIGKDSGHRSLVFHLPNRVEHVLHIINQAQHAVEHKEDTDADEEARLGVLEIRTGKVDNGICGLWLTAQRVAKPQFNVFGKSEPAPNGENHRKNGNDGQYRTE